MTIKNVKQFSFAHCHNLIKKDDFEKLQALNKVKNKIMRCGNCYLASISSA